MSEALRTPRGKRRVPEVDGTGRLVAFLAVIVSSGLVLYVLGYAVVLPNLQLNRVVVQADFEMDREQLLELAGLTGRRYLFAIDAEAVQTRLEGYPPIRRAVVRKEFPDTVVLDIDRRRPLLLSLMEEGGRNTPVLIDETGTIYLSGNAAAAYDAPVLSGITFRGRVLGSTLPVSMGGVLASLHRLRIDAPELYNLISEVKVDTKRGGNYETLLYFQGFRVPVRVGEEITKDLCTYALMILDVLEQQGSTSQVRELDFRSGEIVYRMKEAENAGE
ncbi:MAG: cell division protein FtsQ/DivIB [Alkalispirochaeta sp.]